MRRVTGPFALFDAPPCWGSLLRLDRRLLRRDPRGARASFAGLIRCLIDEGLADLGSALVAPLFEPSALSRAVRVGRAIPAGVLAAAEHDLSVLAAQLARPWHDEVAALDTDPLPPLSELAPPVPELAAYVERLRRTEQAAERSALLEALLEHYRQHGVGVLSRFTVFTWRSGALEGVAVPAVEPERGKLIGLERELGLLHANTEAFLTGLPASDTLLYGPRGSGKSTAVRSLAARYGRQALRLVELPVERLPELPRLIEALRSGVHRYLLFVDDLSFEEGDLRYHPLKTLLEGTVSARSDRVLLYATSNRRHLVRERFADRPDPLDDDVHAWDTQHERLALADRFGLTITFPNADQRRYLEIVRGLLAAEGLAGDGEAGTEATLRRAVHFADWQSGYSGRTARHFIDALRADRLP